MSLLRRAIEGCGGKHADAHEHAGVLDLDANFGGVDGGIEDGADVADGAGEDFAGEGGEADLGFLAKVDLGEIVLVDVADDPHVGEVGDGEGVGGPAQGNAGGGGLGDVLLNDDAVGRRVDFDGFGGVILVDSEDAELLLGRGDRGLGVVLRILRNFKLAGGNGSLVQQELGAVELRLGEVLVVDRLQVGLEGRGHVVALDLHQELALLDGVAHARVDRDNATGRDGDDGDGARDVGVDGAGHVELRGRVVAGDGGERELLRILDMHQAGVGIRLDRGRGRSLAVRVGRLAVASRRGAKSYPCECAS